MSTNEIRVESTLFPRDAVKLGAATMAVGLMRMLRGQIPGEMQLEAAIVYSINDARAWLARRHVEPTAAPHTQPCSTSSPG